MGPSPVSSLIPMGRAASSQGKPLVLWCAESIREGGKVKHRKVEVSLLAAMLLAAEQWMIEWSRV